MALSMDVIEERHKERHSELPGARVHLLPTLTFLSRS